MRRTPRAPDQWTLPERGKLEGLPGPVNRRSALLVLAAGALGACVANGVALAEPVISPIEGDAADPRRRATAEVASEGSLLVQAAAESSTGSGTFRS
jgi:hypothetical protein